MVKRSPRISSLWTPRRSYAIIQRSALTSLPPRRHPHTLHFGYQHTRSDFLLSEKELRKEKLITVDLQGLLCTTRNPERNGDGDPPQHAIIEVLLSLPAGTSERLPHSCEETSKQWSRSKFWTGAVTYLYPVTTYTGFMVILYQPFTSAILLHALA